MITTKMLVHLLTEKIAPRQNGGKVMTLSLASTENWKDRNDEWKSGNGLR